MRFWDSSALVPLCVEQPASAVSRQLLEEDGEMVVWWGTTVECASAFARLRREGILSLSDEEAARSILMTLRSVWNEVQPGDLLREYALRILRLHPLRAADTLQLAAAMEWADVPASGYFVTFDARLRQAARLEGFDIGSFHLQ